MPAPLLCLALLLPAPPADTALRTDGKARLLVSGGKVVKGGVVLPYSDLLKFTVVVEGGKGLEVDSVKAEWEEKLWRRHREGAARITHPEPQRAVWRKEFEFDALQPGKAVAPALSLRYRDGEDAPWQPVRWADIAVEVVGPEDADQKDIRGDLPIETLPDEPSWTRFLPRVGIGLAVVALGGLAVFFLRRRARMMPAVPPDQRALAELDRLEKDGPPPDRPPDWYPTQVSAVLRRYIEERFSLRASRQTTEEFLAELGRGTHLDAGQQATLREFLPLCDLAKFTGLPPSAAECAGLTDLARRFVLQTRPGSPG